MHFESLEYSFLSLQDVQNPQRSFFACAHVGMSTDPLTQEAHLDQPADV